MITVEHIARATSLEFHISMAELRGKARDRHFVGPRWIAMCVTRALTHRSLPSIGKYFGRDHTSVIHALNRIEWMRGRSRMIAARIDNVVFKSVHLAEMDEAQVAANRSARSSNVARVGQ